MRNALMREMELGRHCSFALCNRLDFLPFTCDRCAQVFCKDHFTPENHDCSAIQQSSSAAASSSSRPKAPLLQTCSVGGCVRREVVRVTCERCSQQYCLGHRHPQDHDCPAVRKVATSSHPPRPRPSQSEVSKAAKPQGTKSKSTAALVAVMRMKQKADGLGSIPQSERVYYDVSFPAESALPTCPLFFSKEWSVGKVVDFVSTKFRLRNDNHQTHSWKLLLHAPGGQALPMAVSLSSLLPQAPSGETLSLEYVSIAPTDQH